MNFKKIIAELKRRNVFKVATVYGITGWLIIQIITSISEPLSLPDWFDTAIIILVLIGFPIALIFAWAFEMTPEGLRKTKQVEKTESISSSTGKKLNRLIIATLIILLGFLGYERFFVHGHEESLNETIVLPSIAVLPFEDMSPTKDQEYFSDGLSEELLNVLAKVKGINVAGRTSSFKFKGIHDDLTKIGQELRVEHLLEGSVRKSGNQIRITAQLIKVSDGFHMWSETYDKEYTANNLFSIQDEISKKILKELKIKLSIKEETTKVNVLTSNTEAYEAFLKGTQLLVNRNPQEILKAVEELKKAITLDPKFAAAYSKLAIAYYHAINYAGFDTKKGNEEVKNNADYALLLDNTLGEAYAALGHYYKDRDKAQMALKRAYELEPNNAEIIMWYSNTFKAIDVDNKALELLLKAYQIDPLSPIVVNNLAAEYGFKDNFEKATYYYQLNSKNNPDYLTSKIALIRMLAGSPNGKLDEAFIESYKAYTLNPKNLELLENLFRQSLSLNLFKLAKSIKDSIIKNYPDNMQNQFYDVQINMQNGDANTMKQAFKKMIDAQLIYDDSWQNKAKVDGFKKYLLLDYKGALYAYSKIYPKAISDTVSVITDNEMHDYFPETLVMLEKSGEVKQAKKIKELYFAAIKKNFKHDGDITKESGIVLNLLSSYYSVTNETEKYVEILKEQYFVRKEKSFNASLDLNLVIFSSPVLKSSIYKVLRKRIDEDINIMRTNAVEFLKSEGVWDKYKEDNEK